jgi:hypothetical protein
MLKPRTHFDQVPLETIKEIIENPIEPETAVESGRGAKKKTSPERALTAEGHQRRGKS